MSDVPPEIIKQILTRLPVKSLLRFRCVCKSWRSLIDCKDFITLHLHQSSKTNSNGTIVVDTNRLYYIDLDSFDRLDTGKTGFEPHSVYCSCNGLVLVVSSSEDIVLWNPATRKQNKLSVPPTRSYESFGDNSVQQLFTLAYDSKHDDYKVVRVIQAYSIVGHNPFYAETKIYSLKENSWKRAKNFPYFLPPDRRWGVYLNDALHTVVKQGFKPEAIMAFHLGKEEHYELPMPVSSRAGRDSSSVEVLGGFLAAVIPGKKNNSEIWLMKEYGVKRSWIKLLCFTPPISEPCRNLCPLAFSKRGEEVLLNYDGICLNWYHLKKKAVTIACVDGLSASFDTTVDEPLFLAEFCVGSLVSPGGIATDKQKGRHEMKRAQIPPEIIQDILSRLSVKCLLRLRCVSKSWCSWIDSNHFIKSHLRQSSKTSSNRSLLVDSTKVFCIDLETFDRLDTGSTYPPKTVAGSCNGLVLIVLDMANVFLWNPATRKVNKLPTTPECNTYEAFMAIGYDSKHDDYKVVRVLQACDQVQTKVYSLKANSWKRVKNFPYELPNDRRWGVYLNDALHTVVKRGKKEVIMAYDLGTDDNHYEVPMPEFSHVGCGLSTVEIVGGFLTMVVPGDNSGEVWMMKEYGMKDSWIRLLRYEPPVKLYPLAFSKSGDEVLLNYDCVCLTWYDWRKETDPLTLISNASGMIALFDARHLEPPFYVEFCARSLVSPFSPGGVASEKLRVGQGNKGKEIKKKRDGFLSVGFKLKL